MSFLFETVAIPFWFIVFVFASAAPLWTRWYLKFHKKYIKTGVLLKIIRRKKSNIEQKEDILKKATDHWNANSELSGFSDSGFSGFADSEVTKPKTAKRKPAKKEIDPVKKQNIRATLKVLAESGETGILPRSISDKTDIAVLDVNAALKYLLEKKYAEVLNGASGMKYYLTDLGRKYCINKKYI